MPAVKSAIITDGTTAITVVPDTRDGSNFNYVEDGANSRVEAATVRQIQTTSSNAVKQYFRFSKPRFVVDSDTGLPVPASKPMIGTIEVQIPNEVPETERIAFVRQLLSFGEAAAFEDPLVKGQRTW